MNDKSIIVGHRELNRYQLIENDFRYLGEEGRDAYDVTIRDVTAFKNKEELIKYLEMKEEDENVR